jgi:ferredoxin
VTPPAIHRKRCLCCAACVAVCPRQALRLWSMKLVLEDALCDNCGLCVPTCPTEALRAPRIGEGGDPPGSTEAEEVT